MSFDILSPLIVSKPFRFGGFVPPIDTYVAVQAVYANPGVQGRFLRPAVKGLYAHPAAQATFANPAVAAEFDEPGVQGP